MRNVHSARTASRTEAGLRRTAELNSALHVFCESPIEKHWAHLFSQNENNFTFCANFIRKILQEGEKKAIFVW
ncbi:MAG: hypothetical protein EAZ92_12340 [Candidatus Kapaibacterium sp.]|nr:MAG: hypothetical protein EAZ92_12340 [Candidatus Kapabacteria bacterium]